MAVDVARLGPLVQVLLRRPASHLVLSVLLPAQLQALLPLARAGTSRMRT